jgi:hypothetical protein
MRSGRRGSLTGMAAYRAIRIDEGEAGVLILMPAIFATF